MPPGTRDNILTTMLIGRLQNHMLTYPGTADYDKHIMTQFQVAAALGLIKKTLPDLSSQKVEVTEAVRVVVEYVRQHRPGCVGAK